MQKKKIYGDTLKDQYLASARDRLHNFILAHGAIRGVIMNGTRMINEMRANHELGILETLVLGRSYLGVALMSADLKGMVYASSGTSVPMSSIDVSANAFPPPGEAAP